MKTSSLRQFCFLFIFLGVLVGARPGWAQSTFRVTVSAGGFNRSETTVSFSLPGDQFKPGVYQMKSSPDVVTVQVDSNSTAWFRLKKLPAGSQRTYTLHASSVSDAPQGANISHTVDTNTISFATGGKKVLSYFYRDNNPPEALDRRFKRGGYIHPVFSPDEVVLTNHLNVDRHPHHLGIWSAWTKTKFQGRSPDFWNFDDNTGKIESADSLYETWEGPVQAGFTAKNLFIDQSGEAPVVALNEQWKVRVYRSSSQGKYFIFDIVITQTANTGQPLHLPEYRYGGIGFRGPADWDNPDNVTFLTSGGLGRIEGHATRARWCHIGGSTNGQLAGITIMDHPDNFRYPQPMRIHPDMAFFNYAPEQLGDMTIAPGSPFTSRYRFVTYDGQPDTDELARIWNDFAYPPGVTVKSDSRPGFISPTM